MKYSIRFTFFKRTHKNNLPEWAKIAAGDNEVNY